MKTIIVYVLSWILIFCFFGQEATASSRDSGFTCQEFLEPVEPQANALELFAGYIRVSSQREIYVRIQKPQTGRTKEAVLLVHGLLDSHKRFDGMLEGLLQNGHPVIRVDVYGFGKSLTNELIRNEGDLRFLQSLPYQTSVQDLKDLLRWVTEEFRLGPVQAVGHSMGGGLLGALVSDPSMREHIQRVLLISPYIYRLEQYHLEQQFWKFLKPFLPSQWIESLLTASDPIVDSVFLNFFLKERFATHVDEIKKHEPIKDQELKEALVTSAIATVKGLRELNLMDVAREFPGSLPVDLVISEKDDLVPPELQEQLAQVLEHRNSKIYRLESGHMVPSEASDALLDIIQQR